MSEDASSSITSGITDWKDRLSLSRREGVGFAAPGGEFTRALAEWLLTPEGSPHRKTLTGKTLIELGAGMYHYGYALAALAGCSKYIGVEPFYADCLEASVELFRKQAVGSTKFRVVSRDMLSYLRTVPDSSANILACGIEQCILPDYDYRKKIEREIARVIGREYSFLSSQSDLTPKLPVTFSTSVLPFNTTRKRRKPDLFRMYALISS